MNITLLSNRDLASCVALNHLLPALSAHRVTFCRLKSASQPATQLVKPIASGVAQSR